MTHGLSSFQEAGGVNVVKIGAGDWLHSGDESGREPPTVRNSEEALTFA